MTSLILHTLILLLDIFVSFLLSISIGDILYKVFFRLYPVLFSVYISLDHVDRTANDHKFSRLQSILLYI